MLDLEFWRKLRHHQSDPEMLIANLREIADWPLQERMSFLGFITPFCSHSDPERRAAALSCLAGCYGIPAYEKLVDGLNDPEAIVRLSAVEALRVSLAGGDWARWAHVMFHPRVDVRQAAVRADRPFPPPEWWAIYLLPDAATREVAEAKVEALTFPGEAYPAILGYVRDGVLSRTTACRWIARLSWLATLAFFSRWGVRETARCDAMIDCLDDPYGAERLRSIAGVNPLDELFELMVTVTATEPEIIASLRSLLELASGGSIDRSQIVSSSLLAISSFPFAGGESPLAKIVAVCQPRMLMCSWLPVELRRSALSALYEHSRMLSAEHDDAVVHRMLNSDLCRGGNGLLDLYAVGAVIHLFKDAPYRRLLAHIPIGDIVAAFEANPEASVPFFTLPDRSPMGRRFLIRELCLRPRGERGRLLALLCRVIASDGLDFLEEIDAPVAAEIARSLIAEKSPLPDKKARRIAEMLAGKIVAGQIGGLLNDWLARPAPEDDAFGLVLLAALCRRPESRLLDQAIRGLPSPALWKFLKSADCCAGFPYDRELALANTFIDHGDDSIRSWAAARLQRFTPTRKDLSGDERVGLLRAGLCHRLRSASDPAGPNAEICASLLVSYDLFDEVDAQFARFSSPDPDFVKRLDEEMVHHWRGERRLPVHGHMWLYRWDEHLTSFGNEIGSLHAHVMTALRAADAWRSPLLRLRMWEAVERLIEWSRWSNRERFDATWTESFGPFLAEHLDRDPGVVAARIAMVFYRNASAHDFHAMVWLAMARSHFLAKLRSASDEVRSVLSSWIDTRGLESPSPSIEPAPPSIPVASMSSIEVRMLEFARSEFREAERIAREIVALGREGIDAIADHLCRAERVKNVSILTGTIVSWCTGPALQRVTEALDDPTIPAETRYRIGVALQELGRTDVLPSLVAALGEPGPTGWFDAADWHWLHGFARGLGWEDMQLAVQLTRSPHPHAYDPAVMALTRTEDYSSVKVQQALIAFLECGTGRMRELRLQAVQWLYKSGNWQPILPLLLQAEVAESPTYPDLLVGLNYDLILAIVRCVMLVNRGEADESFILNLLLAEGVDAFAREEGLSLLMQGAYSTSVRQRARENLRASYTREMKLRRVAATFAWGIRVGRELTGKLFGIQMISSEQLGYTRFNENKIYITPLPILRGEIHGREVVRALILHEYGHHMYHRGEEAQAVWKQSETEGLQKLLNLVSDEHLERNLRALDRRFGDQLKLLAAYAFQHNAREIHVENLFVALQNRTFEVLAAAPLNVARRHGCVAISNGRVLTLMEKAGLSFARFVRALRMGLGNRHEDPRVEAALALFKGRFRKSDMPRLYDISRKLREIFGWETDILNSFDQDALTCDEAGDWDEVSEGITDAEVQSEVQNNLQGKEKRTTDSSRGGRGLNLSADEHFDLINNVQPMPYDPAQHAGYAQQVARPAKLLRSFLKKLGIGFTQQRLRLTGKSFDRTRARAVVLKGDPRMLIARELKIQTDLFIGVVVDCSGSMSHNANIEKAKLFGTLIAEAARNYPGVDARFFGFTDQAIYDAGHANRCAVHALNAGGGNNDAAGFWHAALQAKASQRRAKLLVMISDGSPTECSVGALRSLVTRLTKRMKICCAQVAVCPLEHQCFPNHILLDQENVSASVREFGNVMAKLVQKALYGG